MSSEIIVFKFGGASVKDADAVRNVASILKSHQNKKILVVLSAMGKTTNALEKVHACHISNNKKEAQERILESKNYHYYILNELFQPNHEVFNKVDDIFNNLLSEIEKTPETSFDQSYDRIVSYGEKIATKILNNFLLQLEFNAKLINAFDFIIADNTYRDAFVNWEETSKRITSAQNEWFNNFDIVITQGFIAQSEDRMPITIGREGSDFSASIFAYCLNATQIIIWKDVPGIMNADPKLNSNAVFLPHISYREAVELAYYGATVIHPKTIKPLENKNIPLFVKSFLNPDTDGTLIDRNNIDDKKVPSFIFKFNQALLSVFPKDFSFINEKNISEIFSLFSRNNIKVRLMQNSAISFSVCFDFEPDKLNMLVQDLQKSFIVRYNERVDLITIRHYCENSADKFIQGKKLFLEQKSRTTWQLIVSKR